ncbi:MAG: hypothetical protein B6245_08295 [Desulfobacteraceae bacterium 4572_88]|nr:MAG: hypothetical protein B6245_08295 [Desulfobacteraceae bacterium 4572_88]
MADANLPYHILRTVSFFASKLDTRLCASDFPHTPLEEGRRKGMWMEKGGDQGHGGGHKRELANRKLSELG